MKDNQKQQAILVTSIATLSLGFAVALTQQAIASPFSNKEINQDQILRAGDIHNSQQDQDIPSQVKQKLRQELQKRYQTLDFKINDTTKTREQWPDGCLGLGEPDEVCLQAFVPGYEVTITGEFEGEKSIEAVWVFHTDENFNQIRLNKEASQLPNPAQMNNDSPEVPSAIEQKIQEQVQQRYPRSNFNITEMQKTSQQWPDACLGLAQPDEVCAQVIVPGYEVTVTGNFDTAETIEAVWIFHTDQDFNRIRLNEEASQLPNPEQLSNC